VHTFDMNRPHTHRNISTTNHHESRRVRPSCNTHITQHTIASTHVNQGQSSTKRQSVRQSNDTHITHRLRVNAHGCDSSVGHTMLWSNASTWHSVWSSLLWPFYQTRGVLKWLWEREERTMRHCMCTCERGDQCCVSCTHGTLMWSCVETNTDRCTVYHTRADTHTSKHTHSLHRARLHTCTHISSSCNTHPIIHHPSDTCEEKQSAAHTPTKHAPLSIVDRWRSNVRVISQEAKNSGSNTVGPLLCTRMSLVVVSGHR